MVAVIEIARTDVQLSCGIEEIPHDLHVPSVIPHIQSNVTTRPDNTRHFRHGLVLVPNEIEDETGDSDSEFLAIVAENRPTTCWRVM